ncbi:hypothetical protein F444_18963, partial [Phytophthora nicotianae P1976]
TSFPRSVLGHEEGCNRRCNALGYLNTKFDRFCTTSSHSFAGSCENSLQESLYLAISWNARTSMRGITATHPIPADEIIEQYSGHLEHFGPPCHNARPNEGNRMHLKMKTTRNAYVSLDAVVVDYYG